MTSSTIRWTPLLVALHALPVLHAAAPGEVHVVAPGGGGDFTTIQAAVDAAADGDTILVREGSYAGIELHDRSLDIAADGGGEAVVNGIVRITYLPEGKGASLSGLQIRGGFSLENCDGSLLFTDCLIGKLGLSTHTGPGCPDDFILRPHQIHVCDDVVFTGCTILGRHGESVDSGYCDTYDGGLGEDALYVVASRVALYACAVEGGDGGESRDGDCGWFCVDAWLGCGGDGILAHYGSLVYLDGTVPVGGIRGRHSSGCFPAAGGGHGAGHADDGTCLRIDAAEPFLYLDAPALVREDEALRVRVEGPAGAQAYLLLSQQPDWRLFGPELGILHVELARLSFVPLGTIPAAGVLSKPLPPPALPPEHEGLRFYLQPYALDAGGRYLGNARSTTVLGLRF